MNLTDRRTPMPAAADTTDSPAAPAAVTQPVTIACDLPEQDAEESPIPPLGEIPMPDGFLYKEVFLRGQPRHIRTDLFRIRHPSMDTGRRAKLFAPFDALAGFSEAIAAKTGPYEGR